MRRLMWLAIGFTAGIALGIWILPESVLPVAGVGLIFVALLSGILCSPGYIRRIAACCIAGCAIGMCFFYGYAQSVFTIPKDYDGRTEYLTIEVTEYGSVNSNGAYANGKTYLDDIEYKLRFYIEEDVLLVPGDLVEGWFYLRYSGEGGKFLPTYHRGEGILLLAYSDDQVRIDQYSHSEQGYLIPRFRQSLLQLLDSIFPEDTSGFAKALLLGDSSTLPSEVDNAFESSGIRHIIAVSGLHVSILCSFVYGVVGKRKWLTALLGFPVLLLFAALAGFTPSVVRACVMQGLMILAMLANKEYDPPTALAFAVIVILGMNPMALTAIGFQMSVTCVIGIFLFSGRIHRYLISIKWMAHLSKIKHGAMLARWMSRSISTSIGAIILTTPLSAWYFGAVSTVSVLTNLLTLWAITYIFYGIIISCIMGLVFQPVGVCLAWIISWLMRYVIQMAALIAKIPYAMVSTKNIYIVIWLLLCYTLIITFIALKQRKPLLILGCMAAGLGVSLLFSWLDARQNHFQMTVLDVGQGQCILLQSGDGCYVVDCGGDSGDGAADLAVHTLRTQGVNRIDGLILSHYDRDHAGGVESLLSQMDVETLFLPDADPEEPLRQKLECDFSEKIQWVRGNHYFSFGDAYMSLYPADLEETGNNSSMSVLFQTENCDILITGDLNTEGEQKLLQTVRLPELDIFVAGHHGSDSSTSMYLLDALRPSAVVISVGTENAYGHPDRETLQRLKLYDCKVWRTDYNGTVTFRG